MRAEHGDNSQEAQTSLNKWLLIGVVSRQQGNAAVSSLPLRTLCYLRVFMCRCHQACKGETELI